MKNLSQSIIKSTKSLLGRLTTVTTMGCMLALVFLVAASPQPQSSGKARPFKATGIFTLDAAGLGTFEVVGNATHLGEFVFPGVYSPIGFEVNDLGYLVTLQLHGAYTAANGDTIEVECPEWVTQYLPDNSPVWSTGTVDIVGGTGRFANASGSYVGNIYPVGATFILIGDGAISY